MRRILPLALVAAAVLSTAAAAAPADRGFNAHLSGDEEVPPVPTQATGQVTFKPSKDGSTYAYRLTASNIWNPVAAHIHCGARGSNGPVAVHLFAGPAGSGRHSGVLSEGSFSPEGLTCGSGDAAVPLLDAIRSGNAYVNVHTNDGVGATNTGPGDMASGEIRGQLR